MAFRGHKVVGRTLLLAAALAVGCQEQSGPDTSAALGNAVGLSSGLLATDGCLDAADPQKLVGEMIDGINTERAKHKLPPLRTNPDLMQLADFYACRMVDGRFFGHYDPYDRSTVDSRASEFGYAFIQIGENLAARQTTARDAMAALMDSPSHRANILDPIYTEIGVAVKIGGEHGIYWVQEFGRPITDELPPGMEPAGSGGPTVPKATTLPADDAPVAPAATSQSAE